MSSRARGAVWGALGVAGVVLVLASVLPGTFSGAASEESPAPGSREWEELSPAIRSLQAPEYDPRFGLEHWMGVHRREGRGGEVERALRYCRGMDVEARPNCRTVLLVEAAARVPGFLSSVDGSAPVLVEGAP